MAVVARVLHVLSALGSGGVERMLLNYYDAIDRAMFHFDFVVYGENVGELEGALLAAGSRIFHIAPKKDAPYQSLRDLDAVIRGGRYDVVHGHQNGSNALTMMLAKRHGVPVRISHAHGYPRHPAFRRVLEQEILWRSSNLYFACTDAAGGWVHGPSWGNGSRATFIMANAIDAVAFSFDPDERARQRAKYELGTGRVLLQVGRLSPEKNHAFAIDVFQALTAQSDDWRLVIAGTGQLDSVIAQRLADKGLADRARLVGYQADVAGLMSAADVLLMPSESEGLGVVAVEAQASGLPVVASLAVPDDVVMSDIVFRRPFSVDQWKRAVLKAGELPRLSRVDDLASHGYSIEVAARRYADFMVGAVESPRSALQ